MLTPQEILDRRKARRLLEHKRLALEEAVEKRVCERVYKRIWRHRSTLDEVRDEKLRSRTAALALVGIGLKDLGIEINTSNLPRPSNNDAETKIDNRVEEWIHPARQGLLRMNEAKSPLGKLQHLAAAHKGIVDFLSNLHQSSSSADEILPTLIYTLITSPPEGINVISNLHFTQRFRAASKIDGEAAYCLVNLEAAISFLETVDLASLRSDEPLEGPPKSSSRPPTPRSQMSFDMAASSPASSPKPEASTANPKATSPLPLFSDPLQSPETPDITPPSSPHQRRRSNLFQPTTSALGAASDAVRTTADQGLKNIGSTLDHSFKFLFGRLKEQNATREGTDSNSTVILPKTLEDARRLVDPKPLLEEEVIASGASSIAEKPDTHSEASSKLDDKLLGVFAGRKQQPRDRSVDSLQSSGSGSRKVAFASDADRVKEKAASTSQLSGSPPIQEQSVPAPNAAVESMRNLGNSLNPLNRLGGLSVMRGFGRNSSGTAPTLTTASPTTNVASSEATKTSGSINMPPPPVPPKIGPPIQKFIDTLDAGDLRVSEIAELLKDYKRLAGALKADGTL